MSAYLVRQGRHRPEALSILSADEVIGDAAAAAPEALPSRHEEAEHGAVGGGCVGPGPRQVAPDLPSPLRELVIIALLVKLIVNFSSTE